MTVWRQCVLSVLCVLCLVGGVGGASAAQISVQRDVAYGLNVRQTYDVYLPKGSEQHAPVLVMVHGGAWQIGDKAHGAVWENKVKHYVARGAVLVSVNYRMLPEADVGQQAQDVASALKHIQEVAQQRGWDTSRVVLMGHSAGAHLAVLITVDPVYGQNVGLAPWLATVSLDSGALNVPQIMSRPHFRFFDAPFGDDPTRWEQYSPLHRLQRTATPVLLVCSSRRQISCAQAQDFAEAYQQKGGTAALLPQDKNHGEINDELGEDVAYTEQVDVILQQWGWTSVK